MIFALAGNQNCGKTTLFNQLTGSNQHVGNFPGVTVDRKDGIIRGHPEAIVVDLPGIYSLSPYTPEEIVSRDFVLEEHPDAIINIVDATNIERNLYLTLQLIELDVPMVLALNMMDEMRANGGTVRIQELSERLGIPVVPISAVRGEGIGELVHTALEVAHDRRRPVYIDFCGGPMHRAIHSVCHLIEDHADRINVPARFAATKLIEGDDPMEEALELSENEQELLGHIVVEMEHELDTDREAAMADMRYTFIEDVVRSTVVKPQVSKEHLASLRADKILTGRWTAIPIFIAIMLTVFWLSFSVIGAWLSGLISEGIGELGSLAGTGLESLGINPVVESLVVNGIFAGVGAVVSFIPIIVVLFFFLSILEDSGYMARVAFVMDKLLRKIGLSGRSIVPMLIGFGCSVPAIMATRTLASERDRKMTILLTPFMSCSAKVPIYTMIVMAFFPAHQALVMALLYFGGMGVGILVALVMKDTTFQGNPVPFVMELPNYRLPSLASLGRLVWDKAADYLSRAFSIIFVATIVIWFLMTFDPRLNVASDATGSILALLGQLIAPIFSPLGFGDWRAVAGILAGFTAKEAVVSTIAVLTGAVGANMASAVSTMFTPLTAVSFLVFVLLYTPCAAAIASVRREMGRWSWGLWVIFFQTAVAWVCSFIVYRIGLVATGAISASLADIIVVAVVAVLLIIAIRFLARHRGNPACAGCPSSSTCLSKGPGSPDAPCAIPVDLEARINAAVAESRTKDPGGNRPHGTGHEHLPEGHVEPADLRGRTGHDAKAHDAPQRKAGHRHEQGHGRNAEPAEWSRSFTDAAKGHSARRKR